MNKVLGFSEVKYMSAFRCPVCDNKLGFLRKCKHSIWKDYNILCSSCGSSLRIKKYGTSRANAGLAVFIVYFFLGIKDVFLPACFLGIIVLPFLQKLLSPLEVYDPNRKIDLADWIMIGVAVICLLVGLWLEFTGK